MKRKFQLKTVWQFFFLISFPALLIHLSPITIAKSDQTLSLLTPLKVNWIFESTEIINLSPATLPDSIFLPLISGQLVSLRTKNGELAWKAEIGGEITSSPLVDEAAIYVASTPIARPNIESTLTPTGDLRALGTQGGVTLWRVPLPSLIKGELTANESSIFGCLGDGSVISISKKDGQLLWMNKVNSQCKLNPRLHDGLLFVAGADGSVTAFDQKTGSTIFHYQTGISVNTIATVADYLLLGSTDNHVYSFSLLDGKLLWRYRTQGSIQSIVPSSRGLLVTSLDNFAYCLSLNKGKRIWKKRLRGRVVLPPVVSTDAALYSILPGDEYVILELKSGGKLNSIFVDEDIKTAASPVISGDTLFVPTRKGLYAFVDNKR